VTERLKFYTDSHIPKQVAIQLRQRGVDIVRCQEVGLEDADDPTHLTYATNERRVLITHDRDFTRLDSLWRQGGKVHAGIIFVSGERRGEIGFLVKELVFFHEAVEVGAAAADEFRNVVTYLK